jgi:hypothetical protein
MRKLTLVAIAAMFIGTQATIAAPLPAAPGQALKDMDQTPIITVKKKRHKRSRTNSGAMSGQPGNPNAPATAPMQGGASQGSGSMGGGGGMGGAPTTGTSR